MMHRGRCYVSYTWHTTESCRNHDQETSGVEHMLETTNTGISKNISKKIEIAYD